MHVETKNASAKFGKTSGDIVKVEVDEAAGNFSTGERF